MGGIQTIRGQYLSFRFVFFEILEKKVKKRSPPSNSHKHSPPFQTKHFVTIKKEPFWGKQVRSLYNEHFNRASRTGPWEYSEKKNNLDQLFFRFNISIIITIVFSSRRRSRRYITSCTGARGGGRGSPQSDMYSFKIKCNFLFTLPLALPFAQLNKSRKNLSIIQYKSL